MGTSLISDNEARSPPGSIDYSTTTTQGSEPSYWYYYITLSAVPSYSPRRHRKRFGDSGACCWKEAKADAGSASSVAWTYDNP